MRQSPFVLQVEQLLREGTAWAANEPNDPRTWARIHTTVGSWLAQEWREGALVGTTSREAFYIHCGLGTTMTQADIDQGRLRFEVGLALERPAQFVVLSISHSTRAV